MTCYKSNKLENDKCAIYGICSISSALSFMNEVILVYLETLAFYLLELEELGICNKNTRKDFIEAFSGLATNVEYNQESLNNLIFKLYEDSLQSKEVYKVICKEKNIAPKNIKSSVKISSKFNLEYAIKQAHKRFIKKNKGFDENQKKILDALFLVLKSICLYLVELQELNVYIDEDYKEFLSIFCVMNFHTTTTQKIDEIIEKAVKLDNELMKKTFDARNAEFGSIVPTEVSLSPRIGKAILVSGANMKELELLLNATKDKGIDVYTHGQMITGHTFPKLKAYPNLVGHYGEGIEHCISDFSSFPGAIYLTKLALYEIGQLFHGRIFTSDKLAPSGIVTLEDNNFEPLIQSALSTKGFTKSEIKENIKVGFIKGEFTRKVHALVDKIESKKIKNIFAIGVSDNTETQRQYFEKFLELIDDDCFVFSASYTSNRENIISVNIDYVFPFAYQTINILMQRGLFSDLNTTVFYTHCEPHTIPNLFMMKHLGIKNIYFGSCPPNLLNPALIEALRDRLNIRPYTNPQDDLKQILEMNTEK